MSRTYITSTITLYVDNVLGNDTTGDGSAALPWRTIQHAVDKVQDCYDFCCQPTIQLVTTGVAYNEAVTLARYVGSLGYRGGQYTYPKIQGDTTNNAAVSVHPSSGNAFTSVNGSPWLIDSLLVASNNGYGIEADACSHLLLHNLAYGPCGYDHKTVLYGGFLEDIAGPITLYGGGRYHISAQNGGLYVSQGNTMNVSGTQVFSYFAGCWGNGQLYCGQLAFSGVPVSQHPGQVASDGSPFISAPSAGWP